MKRDFNLLIFVATKYLAVVMKGWFVAGGLDLGYKVFRDTHCMFVYLKLAALEI